MLTVKARVGEPPKTFAPVTLELTFEDEESLRKFYTFFSSIPICEAARRADIDPEVIRDPIRTLGFRMSHEITCTQVADVARNS